MSRSWFQEPKLDNDWRIFHTADEKLSVRRRQFAKSFDDFIKDKEQPKIPHTSHEDKANNNSSKYTKLERISELDENLVSSSSCDEKDSLCDDDETERKSQNEDDDDENWESTSSGDENDDGQKGVPKSKVRSEQFRYAPYRSLTEVLISHYYPEASEPSSSIGTEESNAHLLSLDNKLPVVHALNRLEDINKVLKTGHLTTRMERIIEYKQDYPFDEGYDEDGEVNCCDWILYRLTKLYNNFCSTQWPN